MVNRWIQWHIGAFALYSCLAVFFIDHGLSLTMNILGSGRDPYIFIWFLSWWPWAVAHHLNLLYTPLVWQPLGVPVFWGSPVPILALLALPFTLLSGPILSYNLLIVSAPVLSCYCTYRLCLRLTQMPLAAIIGGYLFGFSSYETAADRATLNLGFTMLVPCMVLLALYRIDGKINRLPTVCLAAIVMIGEFLISIEIFATMVLFAATAWVLAFAVMPVQRPALRMLLVDAMIAALPTFVVLSPILWSLFENASYAAIPAWWPYFYSINIANLVIPTKITAIGGQAFAGVSAHWQGNLLERAAYLGLPLTAIVTLWVKESWSSPEGAFGRIALFTIVVASLGPVLWIGGWYSGIAMPWIILLHLPLISSALPSRFALYIALLTALIAAVWIAKPGRQIGRVSLGLAACAALVPSLHDSMKIPASVFFQPGRLESVLGPHSRVLALPIGIASYWHAENQFGFFETGGYQGYPPVAMVQFPAVRQLYDNTEDASTPANLRQFALVTHTQYIIAGPGTSAGLFAALAQLHWKMQQTDDVTIYIVPGEAPPPHG